MRTRRTKINVYHCETNVSWANSHLKFIEMNGEERKEVVINIRDPSDVDYIRDQLNKIVDGWHKKIGAMRN